MSATKPTQSSLSNIQKKILKNTFHAHKNALNKNEQDTQLHALQVSQSIPSLSQSKLSTDQIFTLFSPQVLKQLSQVNLSGLSYSDSQFTLEDFQLLLSQSQPDSLITLPAQYLQFPYMQIQSPLTLKGSPGTTLQLQTGSICLQNSGRVLICEISLTYRKFSDTPFPSLFQISSSNVDLEVRDCQIKSLNQKSVQDTCFVVKVSKRQKGCLTITSCNISFFYQVVKAEANASILVQKSYLKHCLGNVINVQNPKNLVIRQSLIEHCEGSCIDCRVLHQIPGLKTGKQSRNSKEKVFLVEQTDFIEPGAYGINIWSDQLTLYPLSLSITRSKFLRAHKQGLVIRQIVCSQISLLSNEFIMNKGSGCWLQKAFCTKTPLKIQDNTSTDSALGYGFYLYELGASLNRNEACRNKESGLMIVGSTRSLQLKYPADIEIQRSVFSQNRKYGISVLDYSSQVSVVSSRISENGSTGIHLSQSGQTDIPTQVVKCEINYNKEYGVSIDSALTVIESCEIEQNCRGPVFCSPGSAGLVNTCQQPSYKQGKGICSNKCLIF